MGERCLWRGLVCLLVASPCPQGLPPPRRLLLTELEEEEEEEEEKSHSPAVSPAGRLASPPFSPIGHGGVLLKSHTTTTITPSNSERSGGVLNWSNRRSRPVRAEEENWPQQVAEIWGPCLDPWRKRCCRISSMELRLCCRSMRVYCAYQGFWVTHHTLCCHAWFISQAQGANLLYIIYSLHLAYSKYLLAWVLVGPQLFHKFGIHCSTTAIFTSLAPSIARCPLCFCYESSFHRCCNDARSAASLRCRSKT
nr:uncharacterized protein LOC110076278 [Pogona vitticeps]